MKLSAPIFRLKRRARIIARESGLPLHAALDRISQEEGFSGWSHLAASHADNGGAAAILARLEPGDLVLLAARPGQGKTLIALELAKLAAEAGQGACFFTLEDSESVVIERLLKLGMAKAEIGSSLIIDTSDGICADYVIEAARSAKSSVIVIDYLQLLDQRRSHPDLAHQVERLRSHASDSGSIVVLISQVHRHFEASAKRLPDLSDVRLPNPLDLALFTKRCFIHGGAVRLEVKG